MCLIVCAFRYDARFPLLIAANRDEFFSRPTEDAHFWADSGDVPSLLAGKDMTQGGTWLGLTREGRFAAVTNIRTSNPESGRRSRGHLTREYLLGTKEPQDYMEGLAEHSQEYSGFNLLVGDRESLFYLNNHDGEVKSLSPGLYGLSNGLIDSDWPKVHKTKAAVETLLGSDEEVTTDRLTAIMSSREKAPDEELPETGVPLELERALSSSFINNPERGYGTRCTSAIVIDQRQRVGFSEQNFGADGNSISRRIFEFELKMSDGSQMAMVGS